MLPVLDEYTRESLTIDVERSITAKDVIAILEYLFAIRGAPAYIRSGNGPEFIADAIKRWLSHCGVGMLYFAGLYDPSSQPEDYPYVFVPPARYDYIQNELRAKGEWTYSDSRLKVVNNFSRQFDLIWKGRAQRKAHSMT